jgi:hypothetical protein
MNSDSELLSLMSQLKIARDDEQDGEEEWYDPLAEADLVYDLDYEGFWGEDSEEAVQLEGEFAL